MRILKLFGTKHGHEKINKQEESDETDDDCFHGSSLEAVAEDRVSRAQEEEDKNHYDENKVVHL